MQYKNSTQKLKFLCPKHLDKELAISYSNLKMGRGCPYCGIEKRTIGLRKSFQEITHVFETRGYILLEAESEYKNTGQKLRYTCLKHPNKQLSISFDNLKQGCGCPFCYEENRFGSGSANWKGGVTELNYRLRTLIKNWKADVLKEYDYKCYFTNMKCSDIKIHHLVPFYIIRDEALAVLNLPLHKQLKDYTEDQLRQIHQVFLEIHKNVKGVPLRKNIHKLFHKLYGHNCTPEDFEEFRQRWDNNEFKLIL